MPSIFVTSDTHFGHKKVSEIRGFSSTEAHDARVIWAWNEYVKPTDIVYHLGDVGMGSLSRFEDSVKALNGTIHLITGNHDECHPLFRGSQNKFRAWANLFASVQQFHQINHDGQRILMSHFPYNGEGSQRADDEDRYSEFRLRDLGMTLIHGHTHDKKQRHSLSALGSHMFHVGWDSWRRPVNIKELSYGIPVDIEDGN